MQQIISFPTQQRCARLAAIGYRSSSTALWTVSHQFWQTCARGYCWAALILLAISIGCTRGSESGDAWVVRHDGIGPVRVGMSLTEANIALRDSLSADYTFFEGCDFVTPAGLPQGVSFMVLNDTIVRVDVRTAGVPTEAGVRVGDNEAQVMERYKGRVRVEPHKYTGPTGRYLIVDSPQDTVYRLVLETDGERITRYRAGLRAAADLVEGCA